MNFSIMNKSIRVMIEGAGAAVASWTAEDGAGRAQGKSLAGSALQSPDVRRAELAAMLRRALKKQRSPKAQKTYWSAFMAGYVRQNANSNENFK